MLPWINQEDAQDLPRVAITGLADEAEVVINMLDIRVGVSSVMADCTVAVESYRDGFVAGWLVGAPTIRPAIQKGIKHITIKYVEWFHNLMHYPPYLSFTHSHTQT